MRIGMDRSVQHKRCDELKCKRLMRGGGGDMFFFSFSSSFYVHLNIHGVVIAVVMIFEEH